MPPGFHIWGRASAVSRLFQHKIVAMDHFRAAGIAKQLLDFAARMTLDDAGIMAVIGAEAAANLMAVHVTHGNGVAPAALALHIGYTGRQQAAALKQRLYRPVINADRAEAFQRTGDPALARGNGCGG